MIARDLIHAVMQDRWRRNFVLPNYTPAGWWECDVFELTAAGYWREYEVKLTVADFRRDAAKRKEKWGMVEVPPTERSYPGQVTKFVRHPDRHKHELLAEGSERGPSCFWFVVPAGLIAVADVPEWAGLIEVTDRGPQHQRRWRFRPKVTKDARRLHKGKCSDAVAVHARGICYWRMHEALATQEAVEAADDFTI